MLFKRHRWSIDVVCGGSGVRRADRAPGETRVAGLQARRGAATPEDGPTASREQEPTDSVTRTSRDSIG